MGRGKGGNIQKSDPPQTTNLFTIVPPSTWLAAGGGQKGGVGWYKKAKLPYCCLWRPPRFFRIFPLNPPLRKARLVPPLEGPKTTFPGQNFAGPLPAADPMPTYGHKIISLTPPPLVYP